MKRLLYGLVPPLAFGPFFIAFAIPWHSFGFSVMGTAGALIVSMAILGLLTKIQEIDEQLAGLSNAEAE